jgi:hypothetical protein
MAYLSKVITTDLEVQFWDKSFKVDGHPHHVYTGDLTNNIERQKIADTMQEIYDRGRGKRHGDTLAKQVALGDVKKVVTSSAKAHGTIHKDVVQAMEGILERLDETYGMDDMPEEKQYQYRIGIMAGIVSEALNLGRVRGLDEATDRLKKTIWGND